MMDGSFTYMDWKDYYTNDTFNLNSYDYFDSSVVAPATASIARTSASISRWMVKLSGLYPVPLRHQRQLHLPRPARAT